MLKAKQPDPDISHRDPYISVSHLPLFEARFASPVAFLEVIELHY